MSDNIDSKLKIVKGVVFFLTTLIVIGILLLVYGMFLNKKNKENQLDKIDNAPEVISLSIDEDYKSDKEASKNKAVAEKKEVQEISKNKNKYLKPINIVAGDKMVVKEMIECGEMLCVAVSSEDTENVFIVNPKNGRMLGNLNLIISENQ